MIQINIKKSGFKILYRRVIIAVIFLWAQQVLAQKAVIGIIDFYGLEKVSVADISYALKIKVNDTLDLEKINKRELITPLLAVPGVKKADLGLVCCTGPEGNWILYVGISEKDTNFFTYNILVSDSSKLTADILETAGKFDTAYMEAILKGDNGEDDSQGHALNDNLAVRACQEQYINYAGRNLNLLRNVSRHAAEGEQRAIAVQVMSYAKNKKEIIDDLLFALHDSDQDVRNNASRALGIIAGYAILKPELGIHIPYEDFIEMMNSLVWMDRNKASFALASLSQLQDTLFFKVLKKKALPALTDMARWQSPGHAEVAYILLGRMAGYDNEKIYSQFNSDERNDFLNKILQQLSKD